MYPGITRTQAKITRKKKFSCQRNKARTGPTPGLLQPLPIPGGAWESVSLDLITGLPQTPRGFDAAVVFVDRLTKMTHFAPTRTTVNAKDLADIACAQWSRRMDARPQISDRDSKFTSKFWRALAALMDTRLLLSSAYHPQTDGQTEPGAGGDHTALY